ncbi:2-succinyl-5-enolpyruvyl-6-hydroxy-3-cyclohexene-1-carboxylic-acid synthase [Ornithinicoccus halotolerans]|uniref:2-succinyl-5-enolpyruvyl-6-hydroxy-3- cyclohexene-1-carboxylic-acid synthase n=1 Tax=Ornithinicoccus halotolerans TaxID=1748220 RepID=UPI001297077E|nr:2-succinyl-5-enolpyruvyl-6-hydroxy-3-cyclohexene-1-carboxylic-acid synthase [Ornithinicoccus halotolerans]
MTPASALATVLLDELERCGVREVVLAPGSRSAPLAYAAHAADRAGRLRLHVRVDERTAGFLALGLALSTGRPAAVVTTSGTATAHLHPAVLEAHHGLVPLLVLTADRPEELLEAGANQTTAQPGLFGPAVRWHRSLASPAVLEPSRDEPLWRTVADRSYAAATGVLGGDPGAVHLNLGLRDPLVPEPERSGHDDDNDNDGDPGSGSRATPGPDPDCYPGRPDREPWTALPPALPAAAPLAAGPDEVHALLDPGARTLAVLGHLPTPAHSQQALALALRAHWPVLAEPFGDGDRTSVLPHGPLLLERGALAADPAHRPERVVVIGRPTLSRAVARLLRDPRVRVETVTASPRWPDPGHTSTRVHPWGVVRAATAQLAEGGLPPQPAEVARWGRDWVAAGRRLAAEVPQLLASQWPAGPAVAASVHGALGPDDVLVVGSSNAARDLDYAAGARHGPTVLANRGLAGIDGTVSTAVGVALTRRSRRTVALLGDLTFLHDANGLAIGPEEPRPRLLLVVVNDDGGGIFATLEHGEPQRAASFERVFATPTGTDLAALCAAHGVPHTLVTDPEQLAREVRAPLPGIRVAEVRVDRGRHRALRAQLRQKPIAE